MEKVYYYIVGGSGFGGSVTSLRLSEKGKRFYPDDFPKSNWGLQKLTFNRKASILSGVGVYMDDRKEDK